MIYFLSAPELNRVKIGVTETGRERFADLQCGSPTRLYLLAQIEGGYALESKLHRATKSRVIGEWFDLTPRLLCLIADLIERPQRAEAIVARYLDQPRVDWSDTEPPVVATAGMFVTKHGSKLTQQITGCTEMAVGNWRRGQRVPKAMHIGEMLRHDMKLWEAVFGPLEPMA